jgi:hypothetical protein
MHVRYSDVQQAIKSCPVPCSPSEYLLAILSSVFVEYMYQMYQV